MKKFKTTLLTLTLCLILAPLVQSCLDDDDNYFLAIATYRISEDNDPYFVLDDGDKMYPQNGIYSKLDDGQRVYVYFDIIDEKVNEQNSDYNIKVRGIEEILTKDAITMTEETVDSIGDDKINLNSMWFGDGYLNIQFQFYGRRNPNKLHMVNLVHNEIAGEDTNGEEGYLSLEFRHNAYEDYPEQVLDGIVSFKGPFPENDYKGLKIRYNSIYEDVKYQKIDFSQEKISSKSLSPNQNTVLPSISIIK